MAPLSKYLKPAQAADHCNLKLKALERHRQSGTGPAYIKRGERTIRYRLADLDAWMEEGLCWTKDQRSA
jgi:hypothetical protein